MEINTERLVLKPLGTEYLQTTFPYASDLENTRYMVNLPNETIEETKNFLSNAEKEWQKPDPDYYEFAVLLDGVHIGGVCLYLNEKRDTGELGWILDKKYWKRGYATEAAEAVAGFASGKLGLRHLIAHCDSENTGSSRVMERLGMTRTDSYWGRKNKASDENRKEYLYEIFL